MNKFIFAVAMSLVPLYGHAFAGKVSCRSYEVHAINGQDQEAANWIWIDAEVLANNELEGLGLLNADLSLDSTGIVNGHASAKSMEFKFTKSGCEVAVELPKDLKTRFSGTSAAMSFDGEVTVECKGEKVRDDLSCELY